MTIELEEGIRIKLKPENHYEQEALYRLLTSSGSKVFRISDRRYNEGNLELIVMDEVHNPNNP